MPIALLTDFGPASAYVGAMKGVIARLAPGIPVLDLAHDITPQAVDEASFVLLHTYRYFPDDTVFACVVDPGVGTGRGVLAVAAGGRRFVAPDNGLLADVLAAEPHARVHAVTARELFVEPVSDTFHGRDVFAPVAAWLARGLAVARLGPPCTPLPAPWRVRAAAERAGEAAPVAGWRRGRVRTVDRFGNLVTDIAVPEGVAALRAARLAGRTIAVRARTFGEAPEDGTPFLYVGSYGTLEIACRGGSAAAALGIGRGAEVALEVTRSEETVRTP
ncbi:MAG: hypothetical protein KatS3mg102_2464 [Planctomycetota bacterium]|nr:MAG: hypothetical protein KatS3mg102_2464 [Planctomycetota bacterium]